MGQTNVDANGFTVGSVDQTNGGWPKNMAGPGGAWATQAQEWAQQMALRGYGTVNLASYQAQTSLGKPISAPQSVIANPGLGIEAPNAESPLTVNGDGSVTGRIAGTSVVCNLPAKRA